jgi:glycosyltransferase involved in cell wall biosynthesis
MNCMIPASARYHIGIDARLLHYRGGGISETILHLIGALDAMQQRGALVHERIAVLRSRKARARLTQHLGEGVLWTPPHHRLERWALSAELAARRFDVWHATDFIPPAAGARRFVISVYDLNFLFYPQFLTRESLRYYAGQIAWACAHAAHILTISEASRRDLIAHLGVPPDRISVHLLAADARCRPLPASTVQAAREALGIPERYFLFVGTFEPRKNIAGLLDAYRLVRDRAADAPALVLAGRPGWLFDETMKRVDALGLRPYVLWRENVQAEHLVALYNGALALVLPSHYEGFGLPALEAMACGTVPIVSDRSSLPEVVGSVGAQVDPDRPDQWADALMRAAEDDAWRAAQRAHGLERARQFTWQTVADTALAAYHKAGAQ